MKFTSHIRNHVKNCNLHKGLQPHKNQVIDGVLMRKCSTCNKWEPYDSYFKKGNKGKVTHCKKCASNLMWKCQSKRGKERRAKLLIKAGGKCIICGYNKCQSALTFHHRDPKQKSFALDTRNCSVLKMDKLLNELAKCDLLCMNCHMEHHHG